MATPIYLPPSGKGIGGALGEGMSAGIVKGLEKREKEEKTQRFLKASNELGSSADRKQALERAAIMVSQMAEDIEDVNAVYAQVDRLFPPANEIPTEVSALGPDNKVSTKFISRGKVGSLNTPEGMAATFGEGYTLGSKPEDEFEFLRPGATPEDTPTSLGKMPMSKRPEGSITTAEHTLARQIVTDKRNAEAARLAGERDKRAQEYLELAQDKADRLEREKLKSTNAATAAQTADDFRQDLSRAESAVGRGLGKQLPDGTWSFTGENERKLFYDRANYAADLLEKAHMKGGSKNYLAIVKKAVDRFPGAADLPQEPLPPPKPKEPGPLSRGASAIGGAVKGLFKGEEKPKDPVLAKALEANKMKYEPKKYDYKVENGQLFRKPKKGK